MNQSVEPPPPPPDFPPPSQTRSSRRSRSGRSSNNTQQTTSETTQQPQTSRQQQYANEVSTSARTVTHSNHTTTQILSSEPKSAVHPMEMDDETTKHYARFPRMPWAKAHPFDPHADGIMGAMSYGETSAEGLYYGDVMSSFALEEEQADDNNVIPPNFSTESMAGSHASRFQRFRRTIAASLRTSFSLKSSHQDSTEDDESLTDFQDWTPPDSAYGAAFPICGWVPKHYRRLIEATIFALVVFTLVIFIVTTSIRLTLEDKGSDVSSSTNVSGGNQKNNNNFSDDDYYIDYDNYHKNNADDDEFDDDAMGANENGMQADDDAVGANEYYQGDDQQNQDGDDQVDGGNRMLLQLF